MKKLKTGVLGVLCVLCTVLLAFPVSAQDSASTETFTHSGKKAVATRPVYEAEQVITFRSLGVTKQRGTIADITCDNSGNTYILMSKNQILRVSKDYHTAKEYAVTTAAGEAVNFTGAKGIFAVNEHELYIADTANKRVLLCVDGVVQREITRPESNLIPDDFIFQPSKMTQDSRGYLYVLSEGSYYGALLFDPEGNFVGFYGANTVTGSVLTAISNVWDMLMQNDEKRARQKKALPYDFSDICVDSDDFIYTCTGINEDGNVGQVRMLSPGGTNILSGSDSFNFGESDTVTRLGETSRQNFCSIKTDSNGLIYALDKTFGLIYIYDNESNLLAAFGGGRGLGTQTGVFSAACSLALSENHLLVADSKRNSITVFRQTEFGKLLCEAQHMTLEANWTAAAPMWEQVLKYDSFNQLALRGLAKSAYSTGNYTTAMTYAKEGNDSEIYSQALSKIHNTFITDHFLLLFLLTIVVVGSLTMLILVTIKRNVILIRNARLRTAVACMYHPFRSFYDIKYLNMGSMKIAVSLTLLYYFTSVLAVTESDFRYTTFNVNTYNSLFQIVQTIGLILLWSAANWAVSTLQHGNGRLKEVYLVTAYSTLPLILYNLISTPLSHMLASSDSTMISGLHTLALIFTGVMICVGLMAIHDFSFPRFIATSILTVFFMIFLVFVLFMMGILLTQFGGFFWSLLMEALQ